MIASRGKTAAAVADLLGDGVYLGLVGQVQERGHDPVRAALPQPLRVLLAARAGVHPVTQPVRAQRAGLADAGRSTSYQECLHQHSIISGYEPPALKCGVGDSLTAAAISRSRARIVAIATGCSSA